MPGIGDVVPEHGKVWGHGSVSKQIDKRESQLILEGFKSLNYDSYSVYDDGTVNASLFQFLAPDLSHLNSC